MYAQNGNARSYGDFTFYFLRNHILFSIVVAQFYILTSGAEGFQFFHILTNIFCLLFKFFNSSYPNGCKMVPFGFVFFFFFLDLFIHERQREREAETQAEGEAGSMQGARRGTRSRVSRITPWAEGRR